MPTEQELYGPSLDTLYGELDPSLAGLYSDPMASLPYFQSTLGSYSPEEQLAIQELAQLSGLGTGDSSYPVALSPEVGAQYAQDLAGGANPGQLAMDPLYNPAMSGAV